MSFVPFGAKILFPILSDAGVRLQLVLDHMFDNELGASPVQRTPVDRSS